MKHFLAVFYILSLLSGCGGANGGNVSQNKEDQLFTNPADPFSGNNTGPEIIYISKDTGRNWRPYANGIPKEATASCFVEKGNKIFAGTESHGVFVDEGGNNWKSIRNGLPKGLDINTIEVTGDVIVIGTFGHGVFTSGDEGNNWTHRPGVLDGIQIKCMMRFGNRLFAGTDRGIFVSTDQGNTWQHNYGNVQVTGFTQHREKIYAGLVNGALVSEDAGARWQYIYRPYTLHDISNTGKYLFAMTLGDDLLKSDNEGVTWKKANEGLGDRYTFEVKNIGNDLFAAQWTGIFHSTNEGDNWTVITAGLPDSTAFTTLEVTRHGILAGIGLR